MTKTKKEFRIAAPVPPRPADGAVVTVVEFCDCTNDQLERGTTCGEPQCPNMAGFCEEDKAAIIEAKRTGGYLPPLRAHRATS